MEKMYEIAKLKHDMIDDLKSKIDTIDVDTAGKQVDMIKDLAEAEEKCMKACYYSKIIEAMDESEERAGYDHYRRANGQFAPKGTGRYTGGYTPTNNDRMTGPNMRGYTPTHNDMIMPEMMHIPYEAYDRMGYPSNQTGRMHTYGYTNDNEYMGPEHYIDEMADTVRDIWSGATYEQKKKIKSDISALLAEMAV